MLRVCSRRGEAPGWCGTSASALRQAVPTERNSPRHSSFANITIKIRQEFTMFSLPAIPWMCIHSPSCFVVVFFSSSSFFFLTLFLFGLCLRLSAAPWGTADAESSSPPLPPAFEKLELAMFLSFMGQARIQLLFKYSTVLCLPSWFVRLYFCLRVL